MTAKTTLKGVIRGQTIELAEEPGLPDGQSVTITLESGGDVSPPGEGIRLSAGGWADAGEDFDRWLEETRRSRRLDRPEVE